jgi:hypothetical protein
MTGAQKVIIAVWLCLFIGQCIVVPAWFAFPVSNGPPEGIRCYILIWKLHDVDKEYTLRDAQGQDHAWSLTTYVGKVRLMGGLVGATVLAAVAFGVATAVDRGRRRGTTPR